MAASIERGAANFIASDHLAELTLAILQKDRQTDPALGHARDVVPMLLHMEISMADVEPDATLSAPRVAWWGEA